MATCDPVKSVYTSFNMQFEWDLRKAAANLRKHGVSFEEASEAFRDPLNESFQDLVNPPNMILMGRSVRSRLLYVVYVERTEDIIRIISARRATSREEKSYEEGI